MDPWAAKLVILIATVGQLFCGAAGLTSASRTWYAFSRDRGMPGWSIFSRINSERVPFNAVIAVSFFSLVIAIPALFGKNDIPFAFFAITGICTVGLYLAYILPVYLRLRKGDDFEPGPWNLGRRYKLVNCLAIAFVILVVIALDLPYTRLGCRGTTASTEPGQLHAAGDRWSRSSSGAGGLISAKDHYQGPIQRPLRRTEIVTPDPPPPRPPPGG